MNSTLRRFFCLQPYTKSCRITQAKMTIADEVGSDNNVERTLGEVDNIEEWRISDFVDEDEKP